MQFSKVCSLRLQNILLGSMILAAVVVATQARRTCYHCSGINCQRSSYTHTIECVSFVDVCATIYDGQQLLAQGCYEELPAHMSSKCGQGGECELCDADLCNNMGRVDFQCIQCDSYTDENCAKNAATLKPTLCPISKASNSYCYVRDDGNRTVRGCAVNLMTQKRCLNESDCMLCAPTEINGCNSVSVSRNTGSNQGSGGGTGIGTGTNQGGSGSGSVNNTETETNPGTETSSEIPTASGAYNFKCSICLLFISCFVFFNIKLL